MQIDFSQELLHGNRVELWSLDFEARHIVCFLVDRNIFNLGLARNLVRHLELFGAMVSTGNVPNDDFPRKDQVVGEGMAVLNAKCTSGGTHPDLYVVEQQ